MNETKRSPVDGKLYEKTADGWAEVEEAGGGLGVARSFLRGAAQVPGDILSAVGSAMPFGGVSGVYGRPNPGFNSPANRAASTERQTQALNEQMLYATGTTEEPAGFSGRVAERIGRGAPYIAGASPMLANLGGARAVGLGLIGEVVQSIFEQGAEDAGAGPVGQFFAGIPAAIVMPTGIADDALDAGKAVARSRFAKRTADAAPAALTPAHRSAIKAVAGDFGTTDDVVINAIQEWQRRMPQDPTGGRAFLDQSVEALEEARRLFPDPKKRPTVSQILGELGGANIGAMESAIARDSVSGVDLSAEIAGRKLAVVQDLEEQWQRMVPGAPARSVNEATSLARMQMADEAQALWQRVPWNEMPNLKATKLWGAARRLRTGLTANSDILPDEVEVVERLVERYGRRIPAAEAHALRVRLQATIAAGSNPMSPDKNARQRAALAMDLLKPLDEMIRSMPKAGSARYMRAREATEVLYDAFPSDSIAVKAMMFEENESRMISRVLSSPNQARIARRAAESSQDGLEGLQRAAWDHLFGLDMTTFSPKALRRKLNRPGDREAYAEVFGLDRLYEIDDFLKKVDIAGRFITGTPAQFRSTGSNTPMLHALLAGAEIATEPVQSLGKFGKKAMERIAQSTDSAVERNAIIMEALLDDELAETLLKVPTQKTWPAWQRNWDKLTARAKLRVKVRTAGAAGRSATDGSDPNGGVR